MGSANKKKIQHNDNPREKSKTDNISSSLHPKLKIRQIILRTHAHATESVEKVVSIFQNLFSLELTDREIRMENCSGTHGQRITNIEISLITKKFVQPVMVQLGEMLSEQDKLSLTGEFSQRLDQKYKLYFRIDKQQAFLGRVTLASTPDAIQIIIAIQNKTPMNPLSVDIVKKYFIAQQLL